MYKKTYNQKKDSDKILKTDARNMCRLSIILTTCFLINACDNSDTSVLPDEILPDEANDRISISNNPDVLNARVSYPDEDISIENNSPANLRLSPAVHLASPVSFKLVARLQPPLVKGQLVQATSVSLTKLGSAAISYNMRGAPRLGAVDWISRFITDHPHLTSSISFTDSDINAVNTDGTYIYTAVATDAVDFPFPAVIERLKINNLGATLQGNLRAPLASFAATSILPVGDIVYATSGNEGAIYAFNTNNFEPLGEFPLHDARWVALDEDSGRLVVAQGTPGVLSVFEEGAFPGGSMNLLNTFSFPGANVAESKTTVEVAGGKAFIAAGPEGVQIMCLDDGSIIGSIPRPNPASLGLDPSVVVTNAVSVDENLMFISNGEAGIYIARGSENFTNNNCSTQEITVLGKLRFGGQQSANHVAYKSRYLYVAVGLGGVKMVKVTVTQ
ncbi:hypothetical protein MNBD_GAMMA06-1034 [hydrothermal vent metagenome]|uniref:Uncharacterized protein n=1 Tax=hydrothermal vent metagenome TaxID=652676 RepID=A0A3B0WRN4_9ZZZZ